MPNNSENRRPTLGKCQKMLGLLWNNYANTFVNCTFLPYFRVGRYVVDTTKSGSIKEDGGWSGGR